MDFAADLHVHSHYSRATSRQMTLEQLHAWAQLKGLRVVGTGDFTHPGWRAELHGALEPAETGLFRLHPRCRPGGECVPPSCHGPVSFLLSAEVSCIYRKAGRTRRVHCLILAPDFAAAGAISAALETIGNLAADGRPMLGLDCMRLLQIVLDASPEAALIPAHIWTPHFGLLGAASGFDSLEECFEDMAGEVFAVETGLSSDPPMNWSLSALDRVALVSGSDAHSPSRLGREATLFACPVAYPAMLQALKAGEHAGLAGTLELFPAQGKYYHDGHRACGVCLTPEETSRAGGRCPRCGRPLTMGVLHRIRQLADRTAGVRPAAAGFESLVPLADVLAAVRGVGAGTRTVAREYRRLLEQLGCELDILRSCPIDDIRRAGGDALAQMLNAVRTRRIVLTPGYDGCYGTIRPA
jgi:uncharacterized protein (TIGR00375 family)